MFQNDLYHISNQPSSLQACANRCSAPGKRRTGALVVVRDSAPGRPNDSQLSLRGLLHDEVERLGTGYQSAVRSSKPLLDETEFPGDVARLLCTIALVPRNGGQTKPR